jgi:hypothetical protein
MTKKMWAHQIAYFGTGKYTTSDYQAWLTIEFDPKNKKIVTTIWSNMENDVPRVTVKKYKTRKNITKKYRQHLGTALAGYWKFYRFNGMKKEEENNPEERKESDV